MNDKRSAHDDANPAAYRRSARTGNHLAPLLAFLVPTLVLLPFATKAFHIDDTFFLRTAEQILREPLDFYGFQINWYGRTQPASEIIKNPPGTAYFLALLAAILGWEEIPLHAAMAVCTGLFSLGAYLLAARFCNQPLLAALLATLTPAVLVSGNTVMSDIPMTLFYVWALYFWVKGIDEQRHSFLWAAAVAIALSFFNKYFGITALGLALLYGALIRRRAGTWLLPLLLPLLCLVLYGLYTQALYGVELFGDAAGYAARYSEGASRLVQLYIGIGFLGALTIPLLFLAPFVWRPRRWILGALLFFATIAVLFESGTIRQADLHTEDGWNWPLILQSALFFVAGVHVLAMSAVAFTKDRSPRSILLTTWIAGVFLFSAFLNWSITARTFLPLAPAAAIVAVRAIETRWTTLESPPTLRYWVAFAPGVAIALAVVWGDFWLANADRNAAYHFAVQSRTYPHGSYYFIGHWGFQYYMEEYGIAPYESGGAQVQFGDRLVAAQNNTQAVRLNPAVALPPLDLVKEVPAASWITTMHPKRFAGFYTHFWGPIPYLFGPVPPQQFIVYQIGDWENQR